MSPLFLKLFPVIFASSLLVHFASSDTVIWSNVVTRPKPTEPAQGAAANSSGTLSSAPGNLQAPAGDSLATPSSSAKSSGPDDKPPANYGPTSPPAATPSSSAKGSDPDDKPPANYGPTSPPAPKGPLPPPKPLPGTSYIPSMLPEYTNKYDFSDPRSLCQYVLYWQETFKNEGELDAKFDQRPIYVSEAVATAAYNLWNAGKKAPAVDGANKLYLENNLGCADSLSNTVRSVNVRLGYLRRRDPLADSICLSTALLAFDEKCFKVKKDELLADLRKYEQSLTRPFTNIRYAPKSEVEAVCAELGISPCCERKTTGDPRSFTYTVERKGQPCDYYMFFCL